MTNLEIARLFNEEETFRQEVLASLLDGNGNVSIGYLIFEKDHTPLTEEQQRVLDEYGYGGVIELPVNINLDDLIG